MSDSSNNSKTPSPRARQIARQQGRIAISGDLATAISMIGSVVIMFLFSSRIVLAATNMMSSLLGSVSVRPTELGNDSIAHVATLANDVGQCLLAILAFVVTTWLIQTGALFAISRVSPDLSRVSPSTGFSRLFSLSNLIGATLNLVKIAIVGVASYLFFRTNYESLVGVSQAPITALSNDAGTILYHLVLVCAGSLVAIGVVDFAIKRYRFEASLSDVDDDSRSTIRSIRNDPSSSKRASSGWIRAEHEPPNSSQDA